MAQQSGQQQAAAYVQRKNCVSRLHTEILQSYQQTEKHTSALMRNIDASLPQEVRGHIVTYCQPPNYGTIIRPKYVDNIGWTRKKQRIQD